MNSISRMPFDPLTAATRRLLVGVCSLTLLALTAAGCTHRSHTRYLAPDTPPGQARMYRTPNHRPPTAYVAPVALADAEGGVAGEHAAALRRTFAEAARSTGLFERVVATGEIEPEGAIRIEIALEDALTESWMYAMFWGQQSEEYRVDLSVRLTHGDVPLADFSERVDESGVSGNHIFMVYFPITGNLGAPGAARSRAMGEVVQRFVKGLAMASTLIADIEAPSRASAAPTLDPSATVRAAVYPDDHPPRESLHTVDLSLGTVIHEIGAPLSPDGGVTQDKSGPFINGEYGMRLGRLVPRGPLARWLPEVRAGAGFWKAESTLERCSDFDRRDCVTLGTDRGGHWGLDTRLMVRETFRPIDYWGIYFEAGLGLRVEQDETRVIDSDAQGQGALLESADKSVRTNLLRTFGLGLQFGPDHHALQFLAQARFNVHPIDDDLNDVQLSGAVRLNL